MRFIISLILFGFLASQVNAQSVNVAGVFPTIDHSGALSKKIDYSLYYFAALPLVNFRQPRFSRDAHWLLFYAEQALTYKLNKHLSFTVAYVYQRERPFSKFYTNEQRLHVQATYKHVFNAVNIKHRLRFDNRFIHNRTAGEMPYTHRLRYLIGVEIPIKNKKNNLYFTAYEEAFFNTYKNAGPVYAENWAYAALGLKLNEVHKIEAGPLFITWNTGARSWLNQYYLQLTWLSRLDFTT